MALGDGEWSETILGDLHEEHAARAGSSRSRAAFWYCRQACRLGATGIAARIRRNRPSRVRRDLPSLPPQTAGDSLMRTLGLESRYALRSILKRPAMSAIVVLTLALGLGANAAIFSMFDALVLRPFTMPDVDRITLLTFAKATDDNRREAISPADYLDLRRRSDAFEHLAAFEWWTANLVGRDEPENVQGFFVTADFFPALGVQPAGGTHLSAGRRDGRASSTCRARPRAVAAPLRVRPVDRRPVGPRGWRAVRGRRHRAARIRLPHGCADLGPARVHCRGCGQSAIALHHRDRPAGSRANARRCESADGCRRRASWRAIIRRPVATAWRASTRSATG